MPARQRLRLREVRADWRGQTSELLAKAVSSDALDRPMSADDRERMLEWLRLEGGLSLTLRYDGSPRRGYVSPPGVGTATGVVGDPLPLDDLLRTGFGKYLATEINMQTPMFQVVGGTDGIVRRRSRQGRDTSRSARDVQAIEQPAGRRPRALHDLDGDDPPGRRRVLHLDAAADRCCATCRSTRQPELRAAVAAINYSSAGKIGLQFSRRFWEEDDGIFGGITRTDQEITQILYPSTGYLSRKGVLVGYYQTGAAAGPMGDLAPAERLQRALDQGALIHPQYKTTFENAFSIAWQKVAYSKGGWAQFTEAQRKARVPHAAASRTAPSTWPATTRPT